MLRRALISVAIATFTSVAVLNAAAWADDQLATNSGSTDNASAVRRLSDPRLTISVLDPSHIAGKFDLGNDKPLLFDVWKGVDRGQLTVWTAGQMVLSIEEDPRFLKLLVQDGKAGWIADKSVMEEARRQATLPESERKPPAAATAFRMIGSKQASEELEHSPEGLGIVALATSLSAQGIHGGSYPSTRPLHWMAMKIGTANNMAPPPIPSIDTANNIASPQVATSSAFVQTMDVCEDLQGDPYGNQCYGMCGPGCNCWPSVCGTCCCHNGCASHDWSCRNCHWYTPWNCLLCWSGISWFVGVCDLGCQTTQYGGNLVNYGELCGYEDATGGGPWPGYNCSSNHDGSTEASGAPAQWDCVQAEYWEDQIWPYWHQNYRCQQVSY